METKKRIIAITGPSGAGKTTLGNNLIQQYGFVAPSQATTRNQRSDDAPGLYTYLSHEEFKMHAENDDFILWSGDAPEVKKEYGNFYGYLNSSCEEAWKKSDTIIMYVSYKDIEALKSIGEIGIDLYLINLTFSDKDFESSVEARIRNDKSRNHTEEDIRKRVAGAKNYEARYSEAVRRFAAAVICTDLCDEVGTLEETVKILKKRGGEIDE